jgi:hypothetical protein
LAQPSFDATSSMYSLPVAQAINFSAGSTFFELLGIASAHHRADRFVGIEDRHVVPTVTGPLRRTIVADARLRVPSTVQGACCRARESRNRQFEDPAFQRGTPKPALDTRDPNVTARDLFGLRRTASWLVPGLTQPSEPG